MTNKPMLSERDKFEVFWRKEMNVEAMDLHRCEFPMIAYDDQPYACHETERGRLTWMARAGFGHQVNQPSDPVAVFEIDASGYRARIVLDPAKPFPSSGTKLYAEQPATVADHTQCEECKGWGYHENHHEGGGTECGECGGSGKATVSVVMPEPYSLAMFQMISGFESVTPEQFDLVWSACREEVSRLNGIKP